MAESSISMMGLLDEMTRQARIHVDLLPAVSTQSSPRWIPFLQPSNEADFRAEIKLHNSRAKRTLDTVLSVAHIAELESATMLEGVLLVVREIQDRHANTPGSERLQAVVQTMGEYMGVFDVLAQTHTTFIWIWSFLRFILVLAAKSVRLWQRVADMIEDIGHNLPRTMLYQHLLPNKQMSQRIAELYGAVMDFLVKTICFLSKPRLLRFWTMFWGRFEADYESCMNKIRRLSEVTDRDALTSAMVQHVTTINQLNTVIAQQHAISSSLSQHLTEIRSMSRNFDKFTLRFEEANVMMLSQSGQSGGLSPLDVWHGIIVERLVVYTSHVTPEWDRRIQAEQTFTSSDTKASSAFSRTHKDHIRLAIMSGSSTDMTDAENASPSVYFKWAPNMTEADALLYLVSQYVSRLPDKLSHPEVPDFCRQVSQAEGSACLLFELYKQILSHLPHSRSVLVIDTNCRHALNFIRKLTVHNEQEHNHCHSLLIYHQFKDPDLASAPYFLDKSYNLVRDVNVCEGLCRIASIALGINAERPTESGRTPWSQLWVALHYSFMIYAHSALGTALLRKIGINTASSKAFIQDIIKQFMRCVDMTIPSEIQDNLQQLITKEQALAAEATQIVPKDNSCLRGLDPISSLTTPQYELDRLSVWTEVEAIIRSSTHRTFQLFVQLQWQVASSSLNGANDLLPQVGYHLSPTNWDDDTSKTVRDGVVSCLRRAAEAGMKRVLRFYLNSKAKHEPCMVMGHSRYKNGIFQVSQPSNCLDAEGILRL